MASPFWSRASLGTHTQGSSSCVLCRKRKIRCNRESPCSNCVRSGSDDCVYGSRNDGRASLSVALNPASIRSIPNTTGRQTIPSNTTDSRVTVSTEPETPASLISSSDDINTRGLHFRDKCLGAQLGRYTSKPDQLHVPATAPRTQTTSSTLGGTFHVHCSNESSSNQPHGIVWGVSHKNRLFGQSHWAVNGVLQVNEAIEFSGMPTKTIAGSRHLRSNRYSR